MTYQMLFVSFAGLIDFYVIRGETGLVLIGNLSNEDEILSHSVGFHGEAKVSKALFICIVC